MNVAIIGGSLGGLAAGIVLRDLGHEVRTYEKSAGLMDDRGAGIVLQPETMTLLERVRRGGADRVSVSCETRRYLNRDGGTKVEMPMAQRFTSWGALYHTLRGAFPSDHYLQGYHLTELLPGKRTVRGRFRSGAEFAADLVVGADGVDSAVRAHFLPQVRPAYAGYVAWRGTLPEAETPPAIAEDFQNRFTFYQFPNSHTLCYLIPGANGETAPGQRRFNWLWYVNCDAERELPEVLTDRDGRSRRHSLPPGAVREEWVERLRDEARRLLPPQFVGLIEHTAQPFVQAILDLSVPNMTFGRVCLLGDAAFVPRPHTAASTSKAIGNALELARALANHPDDVERALIGWETEQIALGRHLAQQGQFLGNRSQFGTG
jgi:2-polyprenyl-6-methoxyphenol hydroxylase-like FAD-dependent oxidoreductase